MKTKQLLSALFVFISLAINAQTKVSINNTTVTISPSYTVNNGTPITITGQVKNVGTTTVTANVHVNMAIDTSSTGTPKYFKRSTATTPVVGFAPNAIFNFTVTDVADSGNGYKIAGNGTTIVIWSVVGLSTDTTTAQDSVFTNVYVIDVTSIEDWSDFESKVISIQNPLTDNIKLMYDEKLYTKVELLTSDGKRIQSAIENGYLTISTLAKGIYYLSFTNSKTGQLFTKKIIIN